MLLLGIVILNLDRSSKVFLLCTRSHRGFFFYLSLSITTGRYPYPKLTKQFRIPNYLPYVMNNMPDLLSYGDELYSLVGETIPQAEQVIKQKKFDVYFAQIKTDYVKSGRLTWLNTFKREKPAIL